MAPGERLSPLSPLKTAFSRAGGAATRGRGPSRPGSTALPSGLTSLSPLLCVLWQPPHPFPLMHGVGMQPWLSEGQLALLSLYLTVSESPREALSSPDVHGGSFFDSRAARSSPSSMVSRFFGRERKRWQWGSWSPLRGCKVPGMGHEARRKGAGLRRVGVFTEHLRGGHAPDHGPESETRVVPAPGSWAPCGLLLN